jgi:hypothetical protein
MRVMVASGVGFFGSAVCRHFVMDYARAGNEGLSSETYDVSGRNKRRNIDVGYRSTRATANCVRPRTMLPSSKLALASAPKTSLKPQSKRARADISNAPTGGNHFADNVYRGEHLGP